MNLIQIFENEEIDLNDNLISIAKKMKANNPTLPFDIYENRLKFAEYTVGTIQILDTTINILPRNSVFDLKTIFNMILFNSDIVSNDNLTTGYEYSDKAGIWIIPDYFTTICKKLIDYGLTGDFSGSDEVSKIIQGDIDLSKFNLNKIKMEGIRYSKQEYSINITENMIIKSALLKIFRSTRDQKKRNKITTCLREFKEISEFNGNVYEYNLKNYSYFSSNPYYPEAVTIALTILKDVHITFENGNIEWYSFLQNSNNLFETYVRKIISKAIPIKTQKWTKPQKYASVNYSDKVGFKYYVPDIVIGYDINTNISQIVLDVKNKKFNPDRKDLSEIVSASDMYQILFYCRKLKTKLGGLIYPTDRDYMPVNVVVDDDADLKIVLLSINMKDCIKNQIKKMHDSIYENLLNYL